MKIELITVPWDSGYRGLRMGAGPLRFLDAGIEQHLRDRGQEVKHSPIERAAGLWSEAASAFDLNRSIRQAVARARAEGRFPLVLSGNCNSAIGVLAALPRDEATAIGWFDAHGDLNTPETTGSGFFDGMALSIALGDAWRTLAESIEGYRPLDPTRVLLIGARDLDPAEDGRIAALGLTHLLPADIARLPSAIKAVSDRCSRLLLHVDLDVLDRSEAPANHYASSGGLTATQLLECVRDLHEAIPLEAAVIASWDPSFDEQSRMLGIGFDLVNTIVELASGR
jgi:arginase